MQKAIDQQLFRRLLIRNVSLPLLLAVVSCAIFVGVILYLVDSNAVVDHSTQVMAQAYQLQKRIIDSETGVRGFVIAGSESFLEPYNTASNLVPESFLTLKAAVSDNPSQVAKLTAANEVYNRWHQYAVNVIELRRTKKTDAFNAVTEGRGKALMDELRIHMAEFLANEETLRAHRLEYSGAVTRSVLFIVILFTLIAGSILALVGRKQLTALSASYESSLQKQLEQNRILEEQQWIDVGRNEISQKMLGEIKVHEAAAAVIQYLAGYLGAQVGLLYVADEQGVFECKATHAIADLEAAKTIQFRRGETVLGHAAQSGQLVKLKEVPADYLKIKTGLGDKRPHHVIAVPFRSDENVNVVAELGFYEDLPAKGEQFLVDISASVSIAMKSAVYREKLECLYRDVQNQAEELQAQQEELRVSNEELEEQTKLLREAQTRLESQHAELEQTNSQLEEQTEELEKQKETLSLHNDELLVTRGELESKASELARASQYKSEFLANMSHELRTPLNSSLILAKLLADNKGENLTPKQVEFAEQIMSSGNDLLNLINDILDLAKVESGKLDLHPEKIKVESLVASLEGMFNPIARDRKIEFKAAIFEGAAETIFTDRQRVEQILKNLLSNALKFTHEGQVELSVRAGDKGNIEFTVTDSGIGIAKEQQQIIFEAFRQADGTDNRKYSGTGLGLSISKDLAGLLGGLIRVQSEPGRGSEFTLILPITLEAPAQKDRVSEPTLKDPGQNSRYTYQAPSPRLKPAAKKKDLVPTMFPDDRDKSGPNDQLVLIVEDDPKFARILYDLAQESKFKVVVSGTADDAMDLASYYPFHAILLDMHLPDHSGLFVLDHLKQNAKTRHIPVHVISGFDFSQQALQMGAFGYMLKPVKRDEIKSAFKKIEEKIRQDIKKVLIVEDDIIQREAIAQLIKDKQIQVVTVGLAKEGLEKLSQESFDCLIMDLSLPDMSGFDFLDQLAEHENYSHPPVIVYTGRDLNRDEEEKLRRHSQSLIIKGASSPDRLLNEVTLFLHKVESKLEPDRQKMLEGLRSRERTFDNKTVMIVDDDIRNVFALTAALEQKGAAVVIARDGQEALDKLAAESQVDMVLMDIMMPVMNGYEAMREIRKQARFTRLPIIALTAKAMKDDRELCLSAGANDYLAKPVDTEKLVSLIRIWMSYGEGKRNG